MGHEAKHVLLGMLLPLGVFALAVLIHLGGELVIAAFALVILWVVGYGVSKDTE